MASMSAATSVALSFYYTVLATLVGAAALLRPEELREGTLTNVYMNPYVIPPFVFSQITIALLVAAAFGLRPYHTAFVVLALGGLAMVLSFARLGQATFGALDAPSQ